MASAAELPMIAPLEATATKIGTGQQPRGYVGERPARTSPSSELDRDGRAHHAARRPPVHEVAGHPAETDQPGGVRNARP